MTQKNTSSSFRLLLTWTLVKSKQENEALARYILTAPMLDPALDAAKRRSLRQEAARSSGLSEWIIYRYLAAYGRKG